MKRSTTTARILTAALFSLFVFGAGCSTGQPAPADIKEEEARVDSDSDVVYLQPVPSDLRTVISKNYTVGGRRNAGVGEPMVGVRNYTASERVASAAVLRDFRQLCESPQRPRGSRERTSADRSRPPRPDIERIEWERAQREAEDSAEGMMGDAMGREAGEVVAEELMADEGRRESTALERNRPPKSGSDRERTPAAETNIFGFPIAPAQPDPLDRFACRSGVLRHVKAKSGDILNVAGATHDDGTLYYLLEIPSEEGSTFIAVDRRGRVKPDRYLVRRKSEDAGVITKLGIPLTYLRPRGPLHIKHEMDEQADPFDIPETGPSHGGPIVRFETTEAVVTHGKSHLHFDLVYSGTSYDHRGMVYHVKYREYRSDDPRSPMFTKDLAYTAARQTIDVLGLRIRVHDVSESRISYTVLRD